MPTRWPVSGKRSGINFGHGRHVGETILVLKPNKPGQGWLMTMGLNGAAGRSFLGIFHAANISAGPVATVRLTHPTPLSCHGWRQTT